MDSHKAARYFLKYYQEIKLPVPFFHAVLGSGFGNSIDEANWKAHWTDRGRLNFTQVEGLVGTTVVGHHGQFRFFEFKSTKQVVCFQTGRVHGYEGHSPREVVSPVMAARMAGCKNFILTNAAGGLDPKFQVGSVMLIRDHVNMTGQNPLVGPIPTGLAGEELGTRFPDLSAVYDSQWRENMKSIFQSSRQLPVHEGTYLGLLGPSFETPAEVQLFQKWGVHAVGMSTVWEAISLKHSGARVGGLSLISNAACGLGDQAELEHERILEESRKAARNIVDGIFSFFAAQFEGSRG